MILGLDIGGANTKAAASDGQFCLSVYLPLWKNAPLDEALARLADEQREAEAVAVVITGELADCYTSKMEGVGSIMAAVKRAFSCPILFWGTAGFAWKEPLQLAAANWSASAALLARDVGDCLFVDMGSTTTDIIPVRAGQMPAARTDLMRLAAGELVYTGLLRTRLDALLPAARIKGQKVPLAPEYFAIMADARLVLDEISEDGYTCETADGAGKDRGSSLRRLARAVCADLEEIGEAGALAIARQACMRQGGILAGSIGRQAERHGLSRVAAAGIGEGLIADAAAFLGLECIRLSQLYGGRISDVFPAYAVAKLAEAEICGAGGA
ncbi:MAG TPA: hydantoinase/oxoprolinase family protein [Methanothrix sp.]|nr:hydantoinase [Methanothrix sp.]HPC88840.1 hydantoinase/oxoprolinase family protein [Methanothrix sp.]HQE87272.1 hydantoinase/oxoprolinase family protein [Methanothrix sp.]HQI67818.1 hydantoinase/oxoprolinase family protein [Methanothrix sp.]HRS85493.1 hydantoinase/oxoprolinase family protein [Methanothrix sp.]